MKYKWQQLPWVAFSYQCSELYKQGPLFKEVLDIWVREFIVHPCLAQLPRLEALAGQNTGVMRTLYEHTLLLMPVLRPQVMNMDSKSHFLHYLKRLNQSITQNSVEELVLDEIMAEKVVRYAYVTLAKDSQNSITTLS